MCSEYCAKKMSTSVTPFDVFNRLELQRMAVEGKSRYAEDV